MVKTFFYLQCFILVLGSCLCFAYADCPSWDDMVTDGSAVQVVIGRDDLVGLSLSFVYVNPPQLGECFLGETLYNSVMEDLFKNESDRHLFWVGLDGAYVYLFDKRSIYMVQEDQQFDVSSSRIVGKMMVPAVQSAILVSLEGKIDFSEPVIIFYKTGMGTYSNEYWLPDRYLEK